MHKKLNINLCKVLQTTDSLQKAAAVPGLVLFIRFIDRNDYKYKYFHTLKR